MNRTVTMQQPKRAATLNIRTITMTALLSAMAYVLAFVELPVPLSPSFAKMDLSDFPALIGAFAFGPVSGLLIELVKNALQLLTTSTGGVGEIANFLMGASYVVAAGVLYRCQLRDGRCRSTGTLSCCRCLRPSCRWSSSSPPSAHSCRSFIQSWTSCCSTLCPSTF